MANGVSDGNGGIPMWARAWSVLGAVGTLAVISVGLTWANVERDHVSATDMRTMSAAVVSEIQRHEESSAIQARTVERLLRQICRGVSDSPRECDR